jgi:YidC/Oxa1 family membrane protein insertase
MEQKKFDPNSIIGFVFMGYTLDNVSKSTRSCSVAAEKHKRMVVQEAKAKELNDKVVTEATVAVATTGDAN